MKTYYEILGVSQTVSQEEIKEQFRFLAQTWHPDKYKNEKHKRIVEEKFREIVEAYGVLSNSEKRIVYDQSLSGTSLPIGQNPSKDTGKDKDDSMLIVIDVATQSICILIKDLIDRKVKNSYEKYIDKCIKKAYLELFAEKIDDYTKLKPTIDSEISNLLETNHALKRYIERLELHNPIEENFNWIQELGETIEKRRKQLGFPNTSYSKQSEEIEPLSGKIVWVNITPAQPGITKWNNEIEAMENRINERRRRKGNS